MLTLDQARLIALTFPETAEAPHFDMNSVRVRGKVVMTLRASDDRCVVMLNPEGQALMLEVYPDVFSPVPGGWGKGGSTLVVLNACDEATLRSALTLAYRKVAPKTLAKLLDAP